MNLTDISPAVALTPLDGRYRNATAPLVEYLSEPALNRERMRVEVEWMILLANGFEGNGNRPVVDGVTPFTEAEQAYLRAIPENFGAEGIARHAAHEAITHHDVKAVEYYIDDFIDEAPAELTNINDRLKTLVHFACTSEDINNLSTARCVKNAMEHVWTPAFKEIIDHLAGKAEEYKDKALLSLTHGQPASPTRLGKEVMVFVYRLQRQLEMLRQCPVTAKFGGATGNFNAHHVAYPQYDWREFGAKFVAEKLGLEREEYTTQISNYDCLGAIFDAMKRINTIIIDLDRDFWQYVSMEYFRQKIKAGEVGSSAMPHKVNPIDFENSEGNLGIANAILLHLSQKLPVSRLQRDLTDSTVLRNIGVPMGHMLISIGSTLKGLRKLVLNQEAINRDLDNCWAVCAEAIQTILRREAYPHPYEALKALTRTGKGIDEATIKNFIEELNVSESVKEELRAITPHTYIGI